MSQHNIIELNGKRYDAITGVVLGSVGRAAPVRRAVDGFSRASRIPAAAGGAVPRQQPISFAKLGAHPAAVPAKTKKKMTSAHLSASDIKHHQPQKGKTLVRRIVHKPQVSMKPAIKVQPPSEIAAASVNDLAKPLARKLSAANVDPSRAIRAVAASKSTHIRRFQPQRSTVQPAANPHPHQTSDANLAAIRSALSATSAQPAAAPALSPSAPHTAGTQTERPETDIFEAAIAHATSHEQPAHAHAKRSRRARVNMLAGVVALVILGGFITYLNLPGIEMRVASVRVGFHAELPSYKPTGYALQGGVNTSSDGKVTVSFRSGDSGYTISQQPSNWNSQTLLENYVTATASNHQTITSQGRTIYLYNGNNATWVDGGVRYEISGNAPLSANDIVKLATSI